MLQGPAEVKELIIDRDLLYIGRLKDVVNSRTGLERQNQLAFDASESTVSRKHARLEYEPETGKFRLFNDPEQTSVSRDGRGIPCDATRGVQLRSGDELILGKARVRFEIDPTGPTVDVIALGASWARVTARSPGLSVAIARARRHHSRRRLRLRQSRTPGPATVDTIFQTASVGKQFTAALILIMAERGLLHLDDPIAPHFSPPPPAWNTITVRHLLTHTSGISDARI